MMFFSPLLQGAFSPLSLSPQTKTISNNAGASFSGVQTSALSQSWGDNHHYPAVIEVSNYAAGNVSHGSVKFTGLSNIPRTATVTSASISLVVQTCSGSVGNGAGQPIELRNIVAANDLTTQTWTNRSTGKPWATPGALSSSDVNMNLLGSATTDATGSGQVMVFNGPMVVALVQGWVDGTIPNYGLLINVSPDGTYYTAYCNFYSETDATFGPSISVTYTPAESGGFSSTGFYSGAFDEPVASAAKIFLLSITEAASLTSSVKRARPFSLTVAESEVIVNNLIRSRIVTLNFVESIFLSVSGIGTPLKSISFGVTEVESYVVVEARLRGYSLAQLEAEAIAVTIVNRLRNVQSSLNESAVVSSVFKRSRPESFSLSESEALSASNSRNRNVTMNLAEAQIIVENLIRTRSVTASLLESIVYNVSGIGTPIRTLAFNLAEVEAQVIQVIRSRKLSYAQNEIEALSVVAFGRIKQIGWNSNADIYPPVAANPNLIALPDAIGTGTWSLLNGTITANNLANPLNGTVNAIRADGAGAGFSVQQAVTVSNNLPYTMSGYFKAIGTASVTLADQTMGMNAVFNLNTGVVSSVSALCTANIASIGSGWYRCDFTSTPTFGNGNYTFRYSDPTGFQSFYMFGPKVEQSATVSPYYGSTSPNNGEYTIISGALTRARGFQISLVEAESITAGLIRSRIINASILEVIFYSLTGIGVPFKLLNFSMAAAESATISVIRSRGISLSQVEVEALSVVVFGRVKQMLMTDNESTSYIPSVSRSRAVQFPLAESESMTALVGKLKTVALILAETYGYSFSITKVKLLIATVNELETHSFGAIRRTRNVVEAINEVIAYAALINIKKVFPFSLQENEVLTDALNRIKQVQSALAEQETFTSSLNRQKSIKIAIAELEAAAFNVSKLKIMSYVIAETESVSNMFVRRARNVSVVLTSTETILESFNRARAYVLPIGETDGFNLNFGRLRKQLVNITESQGINVAFGRIRKVLQSISNVTGYVFNLHVGIVSTLPSQYSFTITWTSWSATETSENSAILSQVDNVEVFQLSTSQASDLNLESAQSGTVIFDVSQSSDLTLETSQSTIVIMPENTL